MKNNHSVIAIMIMISLISSIFAKTTQPQHVLSTWQLTASQSHISLDNRFKKQDQNLQGFAADYRSSQDQLFDFGLHYMRNDQKTDPKEGIASMLDLNMIMAHTIFFGRLMVTPSVGLVIEHTRFFQDIDRTEHIYPMPFALHVTVPIIKDHWINLQLEQRRYLNHGFMGLMKSLDSHESPFASQQTESFGLSWIFRIDPDTLLKIGGQIATGQIPFRFHDLQMHTSSNAFIALLITPQEI